MVACRPSPAPRPAPRLALLALAAGILGPASGCTEQSTSGAARALQSAGPVAFVCLAAPGDLAATARPLGDCDDSRTDSTSDYSVPHLYALVTQPHRGEVAVVDLTTLSSPLIDQDPTVPGTSFLSVGAMPRDIVATPGSMASFVPVAEPGFEGIFALPSDLIRGGSTRLSSWPACSLPAAPERIALAVDPLDAFGRSRPSCSSDYGEEDPDAECESTLHCHGDLELDAEAAGQPGRYKLVVSLPSEGGIAVIDAQALLDQEAGAFEPCRVDRWLPLAVELPPPAPTDDPPAAGSCAPDSPAGEPEATGYAALPGDIEVASRDGGGQQLFVSDRAAPVIHRIDLPTACEPVELPPLVPTANEDPSRPVVTSRIALGPRTLDLRRFLYAIDETDGSVIVFDVTEGSAALTPLTRPHPELNPFQPIDRVRFNSPPRDLIVLQHASDEPDDDTGATLPVRCDPDPDASGPGTKYRTSAGFDSGAGPRRLRGVFAFAVLASGDIVVIDVDDYDASCRGPKDQHALFGCDGDAQGLATSGEYSCLVSVPHQPRAGGYLVQQEGVAANEPGLQALPLFFDEAGALVPLVRDGVPTGAARMRATIPASEAPRFELVVGAEVQSLDPASGLLAAAAGGGDPAEHTLAMNLGDPRAHILAQSWKVTFEGALPGFVDHFASLAAQASGGFTLTDAAGRFCTRGVLGQAYWQLRLVEEGLAPAAVTAQSAALADYVQVTSDSPVATDKYWSEQQSCSLNACLQFYGSSDSPREARDLRIVEATESSLELVRRGPTDPGAPSLTCCFPHVLEFRVRGGNQWIVLGSEVGLLHHVVPNDDGVCRPACDPNRALLTGRVRETAPDAIVSDDDPLAFRNPFFRLSINQGADASRRDMHFDFATQAPFGPLTLSVASSTANVQPTAVTYLDVTGELVVSDGSLEGITFVDLGTLAITRQYR